MTATRRKREQLLHFIRIKMASEPVVKGVVAVGSIGAGTAHDDSDIDAVVFLDPYDPYIVPAEAIWREADDTFHSIFTDEPDLMNHGLQMDFNRLDFNVWGAASRNWPEPMKAEIGEGWLAFDPSGDIKQLIEDKTRYDEDTRIERLDEAIVWLDQLLGEGEPERVWNTYGPMVAHDRLNVAYDYVVQLLFAYNKRWRTWKTREMTTLLQLPWLPQSSDECGLDALAAPSSDYHGYSARVKGLLRIFNETMDQLTRDGTYGKDQVSEAFIRSHDEPGRAWNIGEWMKKHRQRCVKE